MQFCLFDDFRIQKKTIFKHHTGPRSLILKIKHGMIPILTIFGYGKDDFRTSHRPLFPNFDK